MPKSTAAPRVKRTRRKGDEVRRLILDAAFEIFSERGYAGATTRDIAQRAGANEVLIFRYYGSKAGLFRQAIVAPLTQFIKEYAEARAQPDVDASRLSPIYTAGLLDMITKHRAMFMALITASYYEPDIPGLQHMPELQAYFEAAKETLVSSADTFNMDPDLAVRLPLGLVMAMVLFGDWLLDGKRQFSREELIDAAARMMVQGVVGRPPVGAGEKG